jgi:hypothetical protein
MRRVWVGPEGVRRNRKSTDGNGRLSTSCAKGRGVALEWPLEAQRCYTSNVI